MKSKCQPTRPSANWCGFHWVFHVRYRSQFALSKNSVDCANWISLRLIWYQNWRSIFWFQDWISLNFLRWKRCKSDLMRISLRHGEYCSADHLKSSKLAPISAISLHRSNLVKSIFGPTPYQMRRSYKSVSYLRVSNTCHSVEIAWFALMAPPDCGRSSATANLLASIQRIHIIWARSPISVSTLNSLKPSQPRGWNVNRFPKRSRIAVISESYRSITAQRPIWVPSWKCHVLFESTFSPVIQRHMYSLIFVWIDDVHLFTLSSTNLYTNGLSAHSNAFSMWHLLIGSSVKSRVMKHPICIGLRATVIIRSVEMSSYPW